MDNIVRTWEEIELTDAELEAVYGAAETLDEVFEPVGTTSVSLSGFSRDEDTFFGTFVKIVTSCDPEELITTSGPTPITGPVV